MQTRLLFFCRATVLLIATTLLAIRVQAQTYCTPNQSNTLVSISNFVTTGAVTNISNASGQNAGGYGNYSGSVTVVGHPGNTITFFLTEPYPQWYRVAIWVDYNDDGDFGDAGELVYNVPSPLNYGGTMFGNFTIPANASLVNTRMRVLALSPTSDEMIGASCGNTASGSEYEDYAFNIINACTGAPTAGTASAPAPFTYCGTAPAKTLSLSGYTTSAGVGIIGIQWQSSADNATWTDLAGATSATYTTLSATTTMYYRARVTCATSGLSSASNPISIAIANASSPTATGYAICQNAAVPAGGGLTAAPVTNTGTITLSFDIGAQPGSEPASPPGNAISSAAMPPLPDGAVITSVTIQCNGIDPLIASPQMYVRLGLSGAVTLAGVQSPGTGFSSNPFYYIANSAPSAYDAAGGMVYLNYWSAVNTLVGSRDADFPIGPGVALATINYAFPTSSIQWYTGPAGGSPIATGTTLDPVSTPGSGLTSTATPGSYTFYAQGVQPPLGCPSILRTPATFVVVPPATIATQPADQVVCTGQPLSLAVSATNGTVFQWKLNGSAIAGATSATYSVASATPAHAGSYTVAVSNASCATVATSNAATVTVHALPGAPTATGYAICQNAAMPAGSGLAVPLTYTGSVTLNFSKTGGLSGTEPSSPPGMVVGNAATLPALPPGATVTGVTISTISVFPVPPSTQSQVRLGLSGAITLDGVQSLGATNGGGLFNYSATSVPSAVNMAGGAVNITYWEPVNDITNFPDAGFTTGPTAFSAVVNYTYPLASTIRWFTSATGGSPIATGTTMDPTTTPGSGVSGTATPGSYTFYAQSLNAATGCVSATRTPVTFLVAAPPAITTQPLAPTVCAGQPLSLSVVAGNAASYQWSKDGAPIAGATGAGYAVASATAAHAGSYTVAITGLAPTCAGVTSNAVTATVQAIPVITTQPTATAACVGQQLALSVTAGNAGGYQWSRNGTPIAGATAATYTVASAAFANAGKYSVMVSGIGPCASVQSDTITAVVGSIPGAPASTAGYSICASAPVPAGSGLGATVAYPAPTTGSVTLYFQITAQPGSEPTAAPGITVGNAATLSLPPDATITSVTITCNGILPIPASYQSEIRLGLSGAITLSGIQSPGSTNTISSLNYNATSVPAAFNPAGGTVNVTYWETYNDYPTSRDANFPAGGAVTAVVNYSIPASSVQWFTAANGGTAFASGTPLDPSTAPGSGISNPTAAGSYLFYAGILSGYGCPSATRTPATFTVKPAPAASLTAPATACVGTPSVVATIAGSGATAPYTFTYNVNGGSNQTTGADPVPVRYIRIQQNATDWLNLTEMRALQAGTGANVALNKPGTSNAANPNYLPVRLTNGVLTDYFHSSSTAAGNWVEVDLGAEYALSAIQIVNRYDCCQNRSANLQLILKNGSGTQVSSQQINAYQGQNTAFTSSFSVPIGTAAVASLPVNTANAGTQQYNLVSVSSANGCSTALAAAATVTVQPTPVITTEPPGSLALCAGNPLLVGVSATGATGYQWRKDGADIPGATGSNYAVPTSETTNAGSYRAIAIGNGGCTDTSVVSAVLVTPMATTLVAANTTASSAQPDGYSLTYTDASCQPIASITDNSGGNFLGLTSASVFVDGAVQTFNGSPYLQRHYNLTPSSNGAAMVKLYATQAEFDAYNDWVTTNAPAMLKMPSGQADVAGISNISITQFHGLPSSGTSGPGGQYNAAQSELIPNSAITTLWNGSYWTMSFGVAGFSGFFISTGSSAALPVALVSVSAANEGTRNRIDWESGEELHTDRYEVERSADGAVFTGIADAPAKNKPSAYTVYDDKPLAGLNHYRLRMVDADGSYRYSKVVTARVPVGGAFAVRAYPNPVSKLLTVEVSGGAGNGTVELSDVSGKVMGRYRVDAGVVSMDMERLAAGVYFLRYADGQNTKAIKVSKE